MPPPLVPPSVLTAQQREQFDADGVLHLPGLVPPQECEGLRRRAAEIVDAWDPRDASVFTTREQERTSDEVFLSSAGQVHCFAEPAALGPDGGLVVDRERAVNKIGHAQHDLDPVYDAFARRPAFAGLAADLGLVQPLLVQSMHLFKHARVGGEVGAHDDATFLPSDPLTVRGLWVALQPATVDNGCLWALRGGHRGRGLRRRFARVDPSVSAASDAAGTRFVDVDDDVPPVPEPDLGPDGRPRAPGWEPLEADVGDVVVLHGLLPHASGANTSDRGREAYSLHLLDGAARVPDDAWLRRPPHLPFRGFAGGAA